MNKVIPVAEEQVQACLVLCSFNGAEPHQQRMHIDICNAAGRILRKAMEHKDIRGTVINMLIGKIERGEIDVNASDDHPPLGTRSEIVPGRRVQTEAETVLQWDMDHWVARLKTGTSPTGYGTSRDEAVRDLQSKLAPG